MYICAYKYIYFWTCVYTHIYTHKYKYIHMEQLKVMSTCKHTHTSKVRLEELQPNFQLSEELGLFPTSHTVFLCDQD